MVRSSVKVCLRALWSAIAVVLVADLVPSGGLQAQPGEVVVFAAASLKNALDDVGAQWQKETGKKIKVSYGASSALAKQIEQGAPADVFISADLDWMDYLDKKGLVKSGTRANLLGNSIVLIAPKGKMQRVDITPGLDLAGLLGDGRLAMANVDSVPAGKYGKAALEKLGLWASISARTAQAENVRAALLLVSRAEAPLGIVYKTDAAADPNVAILGTFPPDTHPPIVYPIGLIADSRSADAAAFLEYVTSAKAKPLFEAQGFTFLGRGQS